MKNTALTLHHMICKESSLNVEPSDTVLYLRGKDDF